jgi:hypothetical protein
MTDGSPKSGLPVDLVGTLSDGCQPFFAFLALKKLDNHLEGQSASPPEREIRRIFCQVSFSRT